MSRNYRTTKRNLIMNASILVVILLAGCATLGANNVQDYTPAAIEANASTTVAPLATSTPKLPDEDIPALWTWIVTQNDRANHLFCLNKPVFANGAAECQQEDGIMTYVSQGPLVEVRPGRIEMQQNLGEYTWIVNIAMSGPSNLRIGRLYCVNPPIVVNGYAECIHPNETHSYVAQGIPIIAIPGFTDD